MNEEANDPQGSVEIAEATIEPEEILAARRGPGANCSSVGSALDLLFLSATLAGVVMAGIAAAFGREPEAREGKAEGSDAEGDDASAR